MKRSDPVCVTAVGVAHALGLNWLDFGANLADGGVGIASIGSHPLWNSHESLARVFSWVPPLPDPILLPAERRHLSSGLSRLALHCASQLGGFDGFAADRAAVVIGTGFGNLADLESSYRRYFTEGKRRLSPLTVPVNMNNTPANLLSQVLGFEGPSSTVSAACASGLKAVIEACRALEAGRLDCAIAGGLDLTVCPTLIDAWDKMRVLSPETEPARACRPLAVDRPGLVLGEGGALFRLERLSTCHKRGTPVLGILRGWHENCDAFDLVAPRLETQVRCISGALQDAELTSGQISSVHLHATGTDRNDRQELEVLSQVFGERLPGLSLAAIKAQTGHSMGASGTLSLAAALYTLHSRRGFSLAVEELDWPSPLNLTPSEPHLPEHTLINCFAFGGTNCCLVLTKP